MSPLFPVGSSVYFNPARTIERERFAEEQEIRRRYTAQLAESEKSARATFEADLKAKKDAARADFESGLTAEKNKVTFETDLASQEAVARSQFESQLSSQRRGFVKAPLRAAKREYAMVYGMQMLPRLYRAAKAGRAEAFTGLAEAQREGMEDQLAQWKSLETEKQQQAVKEWESSELSTFEGELQAWEKEQRATFEYQVTGEFGWKETVKAQLEADIEQWRKGWQPKGLAERIMEIKIPSLDLVGKLSDALGLTPKAIGKLVLSPEGFKVPKTEFAPLAAPAGIVASVESLVYGVGQLAGLKTPRMPPTLTGGLVGSGFESIMGGRLAASPELQQIVGMEPAYGAGTLLGDILVSYGISKGVKAGTKAVKGVAGYIYEESGLKYSHALYEAKKLSLKISGYLPKSPAEAIRESHLAYEMSDVLSSLKSKILPTKFMEVPAEGIVGLPSLEEVPEEAALALTGKGLLKGSKILETAKAVGLTPLEYEEALYPKIFAGMELLGWTEAPKTAGLGFTVGAKAAPTIAKSVLSEALAETMWIGATAEEKWAVRAGVIPSPEDVIIQPPKEIGEQMIKGGRYFDIDLTRALGFSKFPYKEAATGKYFFEKEKLPSLKDLLKAVKAETTLSQLIEAPARILPSFSFLPEGVKALPSLAPEILGVGGVLLPHLLPRKVQKPKKEPKTKPILLQALSPLARTVLGEKQKQVPEQITIQVQKLKQPFLIRPPSSILFTPRSRRDEGLPKQRKPRLKGKGYKRKMAGYLYPVLPVEKLPRFLLGRVPDVSRYILGKPLSPKRHHRSR